MSRPSESGFATVEAALALVSMVVVLTLCCGAVLAMSMQVRCVDAAREAARLAARGDPANARPAAVRVAPGGAQVAISNDGSTVTATVSARSTLLPLVRIKAAATAALEPGQPL